MSHKHKRDTKFHSLFFFLLNPTKLTIHTTLVCEFDSCTLRHTNKLNIQSIVRTTLERP